MTSRGERLRPGVGAELRAARLARGLEISEVAAQVMLSTRQIADLESEPSGAFYNDGFRIRAAHAYAQWLGLPDVLLPGSEPAVTASALPAVSDAGTKIGRWPAVVAAAVLLLIGGYVASRNIGAREADHGPSDARAPIPAASVPAPMASGPSAPPQFALTAEEWSEADLDRQNDQSLVLSVSAPSWLFVRYADGQTVERQLESGEAFPVTRELAYLALGTERAELSQGGRTRRLDAWASQGQIRINRTALDQILSTLTPH